MAKQKRTTPEGVNGGQSVFILTGKTPIYKYENKRRISDTPIAIRYSCAAQGDRFTPINVQIDGADPLPNISDDDLLEACANLRPIFGRFVKGVMKITSVDDNLITSGVATGIELVKSKQSQPQQ